MMISLLVSSIPRTAAIATGTLSLRSTSSVRWSKDQLTATTRAHAGGVSGT
jgi:hypothetical protein